MDDPLQNLSSVYEHVRHRNNNTDLGVKQTNSYSGPPEILSRAGLSHAPSVRFSQFEPILPKNQLILKRNAERYQSSSTGVGRVKMVSS